MNIVPFRINLGKMFPLKLTFDSILWTSAQTRKKNRIERLKATFKRHQPPILIGDFIGSGGFAEVYKAVSNYNGVTKFAIKILRTDLLGTRKGSGKNSAIEEMRIKDIKKRFTNESYVQWDLSQSLSERVSQSVVRVFDHGEFDNHHHYRFILMERMGSTLRDFMVDEINSKNSVELNIYKAMLMTKIADLIHNIHSEGIIHRDIKPENIFFCRDDETAAPISNRSTRRKYDLAIRVKLGDFGTVRWVRTYSNRFDGVIIGSQWYLSPEQILSPDRLDIRTDIYSFGIICYELLFNTFPKIVNPKTDNILEKLVHANPVQRTPPPKFEPLSEIIFKCLEKDLEKRYQSMEEVVRDLRLFLESVTAKTK
jgi:eukaryotic-like serine/threonine-protein kinase